MFKGLVLTYNSGPVLGRRKSYLFLVKNDILCKFDETKDWVHGFYRIMSKRFWESNEVEWKTTTYKLYIRPGVKVVYFIDPIAGVWGEYLKDWAEAAKELGVTVQLAQEIVRISFPTQADRLDKIPYSETDEDVTADPIKAILHGSYDLHGVSYGSRKMVAKY